MLDELYDDLERAGGRGGRPLSAKTVANVAGALHKALVDAVKPGRIKRSPADAVSPPSPSDAHTSWWSIQELRDAGWMRVDWMLGHVGHTLTWKPRPKSRAGERTMALALQDVSAGQDVFSESST